MNDKFDEDKLKHQFEKMKHKAEKVLDDPDQLKDVADSAWDKAKELKQPLAQVWAQLKSMISMIRSWASGEYRDVPTTSIIAIVAGLMYLLSPIDLIPDFIPLLGYLDDIFVLGVVFTQVAKDIRAFDEWAMQQPPKDDLATETQMNAQTHPPTESADIKTSPEDDKKPETEA